jgi:hypothetical protein
MQSNDLFPPRQESRSTIYALQHHHPQKPGKLGPRLGLGVTIAAEPRLYCPD